MKVLFMTILAVSLIGVSASLAGGRNIIMFLPKPVAAVVGNLLSLLAGSSTAGYTDATGAAAKFGTVGGLASDSAGNTYVADSYNNVIRRITASGVVSTFAGVAPGTDGTGQAASFTNPQALAFDVSGNMFVADTANHIIRKVTSVGVVTTLAGTNGVAGSTDATGTAASFNSPAGIAVASSGLIYVADTGNSTIRKIASGVVTTYAGQAGVAGTTDGTGTAALFNGPTGIKVDTDLPPKKRTRVSCGFRQSLVIIRGHVFDRGVQAT